VRGEGAGGGASPGGVSSGVAPRPTARASHSAVASSKGRATTCTLPGKPAGPTPVGTATAGRPVRLNGAVVRTSAFWTDSATPPSSYSSWLQRCAAAGAVGALNPSSRSAPDTAPAPPCTC